MSDRQKVQAERHRARVLARPDRPECAIEVGPNGGRSISGSPRQNDVLYGAAIFDALGTRSDTFFLQAINNVCEVIHSEGKPTAHQLDSAVAIIAAIEPENELETMLAVQIVGADRAARRCLSMMGAADYVDQYKTYGDLANKFIRSTATLVDSLAKLRRGGEQVVKHIHVHEGGQAVVADTFNHNQGGGGREARTVEQSQATEAAAGVSALPRPDAAGFGVPIPGDAERSMSHARRD